MSAIHTAFIVGAPRSGTTVLGDILSQHPRIVTWYEPHFVVEKHVPCREDDVLTTAEAGELARRYIRQQFSRYGQLAGAEVVVDKSPRNSLRIPFLRSVFPDAKFVHIVRDGRDTVLSMRKQWERREDFLHRGNITALFEALYKYMSHQPHLRYKLAFLWYEVKRTRLWEGRSGWGPRFPGWKAVFDSSSSKIEYNAYQWRECIQAVERAFSQMEEEQHITLYYEELLDRPEETLTRLLQFLGYEFSEDLFKRAPALQKDNYNKWPEEMTKHEWEVIRPVMQPVLERWDYPTILPRCKEY